MRLPPIGLATRLALVQGAIAAALVAGIALAVEGSGESGSLRLFGLWAAATAASALAIAWVVTAWSRPLAALQKSLRAAVREKQVPMPIEDVGDAAVGRLVAAFNAYVGQQAESRRALEESERKYRDFFESSSEVLLMYGADGLLLDVHFPGGLLLGFTKEEFLRLDHARELCQDPEARERMFASVRERGSGQFETWIRDSSGTPLPMQLALTAVKSGGEVVGFRGIARNAKETKLTEERLIQSERRLRQAQAIASIGNWELDIKSGALWWSEEVYRIFEVEASKFERTVDAFLQFVHPEDREVVLREYEQSVERHTSYRIRHRLQFAGGRIKYVEERCETEYLADGTPVLSRGTVQDVTQSALMEASLRESEERLRLALAAAEQGLFDINLRTGEIAFDAGYAKLMGYAPEELVKAEENWLEFVHPEDRERLREAYRDHLDSQRPEFRAEYRMRTQAGSWKWLLALGQVVSHDGEGNALRVLGTITDVTARHHAEEATRAREAAEQANRAKSDFLARMSHELRTPLSAILSFSEILQLDASEPLAPGQKERVARIHAAGKHLLHLINDLLDISRIEAGSLTLQLEVLDVRELVEEATQALAGEAKEQHLVVTLDATAQEPLRVYADRTRLRQVLLNLLSNAIKYNVVGGSVEVWLAKVGDVVLVTVEDRGVGMTPSQVQGLFQPFDRLGREKTKIQGSGIGLVIARHLVELMGGSLSVVSRENEGSKFTISLRAARQESVGGADVRGQIESILAPSILAVRPNVRGRILYVEDDEACRAVIRDLLLLRPQVQLELAVDAEAGLLAAERLRPDAIFIDMCLPGMSGLEFVARMRNHPGLKSIPCVIVSANASLQEIAAAHADGCDAYLTKPITAKLFLQEVDRLLSVH